MDAGHPSNWDPTWMGHSIGKWDGDVLVVDTAGFNDRSWLGGMGGGNVPHTEMLHMTERYRRVDFGHMEVAVTFEDPGTFVKPFHMNVKFDLCSAGGDHGVRLREQQAGAPGGRRIDELELGSAARLLYHRVRFRETKSADYARVCKRWRIARLSSNY